MSKKVGDYEVEYAKSDRSKCNLSKENISKGAIRIGKIVQSQKFDGVYPLWYDFETFLENDKAVKAFKRTCKVVHGLGNLRVDDQARINELMGVGGSEDGEENKDPKFIAFQEENKKLWKLKDELSRMQNKVLKEMLELNDQNPKGGEADLAERCAYGMLFGALPRCPRTGCKDNFLKYSNGKYRCTGKDEWARCSYEAELSEVKTKDWEMPDDYDDDFINDFKFVRHEKVDYVPPKEVVRTDQDMEEEKQEEEDKKAEEEKTKQERAKKEHLPLGNYVIAFSGKLSQTQSELKELIEEAGAKYSTTVSGNVDYLISTESDINKNSAKVQNAKSHNVPIMEEDFLHNSIEEGKKLSDNEQQEYCLWKPTGKKRKVEEMSKDEENPETEGIERPNKKVKIQLKGSARVAVDPDCEVADSTHVLEHSADAIFSVNLSLTDISRGMNSYYILQVLESDSKSEYYVFRKWGRTGSTQGSHKLEEYGKSKNNAINQFEKLYLEKTGNDWEDRRNFQKKPGKMYPLEVDFGGGEQSNIEKMLAAGDTKKTYGGKLKPAVRSLIELIFDVKEMVRALVEMEIDINKMPLGKLSKNTLKEGFAVLSEVQTILDQVDADEKKETPEDEKTSSSQQDENAPNPIREKILKRYKDQLTTLSNKFYTVIPHTFDRNTGIAILDSRKLLKEKTEMVDALMEMEVATSLLNSNTGDSGEDTIDVNYKKLKTELEPLDHDSKEFKMLNEYLQNTHASTHSQYTMEAVDIFKVSREGEREAYVKEYGELKNKQLLWHGSRLTNWAGILSQGLRIAPPEAPATGYMFGKGIYFANMSSKSANYCFTNREKNTGILILNEVALGETYDRYGADYITTLPKGKSSCWGRGNTTPNTKGYQELDGVIVPMGKGTQATLPQRSSLLYDEFITYDVKQSSIKYLFRTKFNYKN